MGKLKRLRQVELPERAKGLALPLLLVSLILNALWILSGGGGFGEFWEFGGIGESGEIREGSVVRVVDGDTIDLEGG